MKTRFAVIGVLSAMLMALANVAYAQPVDLTSEVEPYFTGLRDQAVDLIPFALGIIAVGVTFALVRGWFKRSKG